MAHDNETNTLELHIKVNGQNLSATSEKCNIGTLRIPSDPSWPKIPSRRLSNNTDDIIEPSRVVTLTGTSETQTLRQCSVLSCMINTALRDSTTAGGGPSSDPVANVTADVHESAYQVGELRASSVFARKIKQRRMKRASKWLLGLRAIALLCIAMYVAVIFLPMMYDYFLAEEYDDGNANYIELTFRYIASSFGEALDGVIDVLATILLRPARFDRKQ